MTIEQKLLSVRQVSTILNVSRGSVYRLIASNTIPHVAIGSRKMVSLDTLKKLLSDGSVTVEPLRATPVQKPPRKAPEPKSNRDEQIQALMKAAEAVQHAAQALALH